MKRYSRKKFNTLTTAFLLLALLLAACNNIGASDHSNEKVGSPTTASESKTKTTSPSPSTREFTDSEGNQVQVPVNPQRIVLNSNRYGDLKIFDVPIVGLDKRYYDKTIFPEVEQLEDIGFPINLEKTLSLTPDLIMLGDVMNDKEYDNLSKIAPTITYDYTLSIADTVRNFGKLLGKEQIAESWITSYEQKAKNSWNKLRQDGVIGKSETATALVFFGNKKWYVMGSAGITSTLYHPLGFKPAPKVQEIIDAGQAYPEVSAELLHEYVGDRLFVLTNVDKNGQAELETFMKSPIWTSIPAVKNGKMVKVDYKWNYDDATTANLLLDELPNMLIK
ncbi:ABC transporter substrate-binding protein [Paenibacillus sp. UMB4589-SE434]|nr:ABC transporter substrate-binding protein [Paenibacillus sp. UMB4589-SE434]